MGDTPFWSGGKLGPYHLGRRYRETGADLGRLYEAHNVDTGGRALVLTPGRSNEWRPKAGWSVRAMGGAFPPFLALEVEHAPRDEASALQELTLMFHRLAGALARVEHRPDVRAHLTREPLPRPLVRQVPRRHWLLGVAVGLTAMVLLVALWPRTPKPAGTKHAGGLAQVALDEPSTWVDLQEASPRPLSYPMPDGPFQGQMKPPCHPAAVELRGGCWVQMKQDAPCPKGSAEHEGKCYVPVREKTPEPRSLQP